MGQYRTCRQENEFMGRKMRWEIGAAVGVAIVLAATYLSNQDEIRRGMPEKIPEAQQTEKVCSASNNFYQARGRLPLVR